MLLKVNVVAYFEALTQQLLAGLKKTTTNDGQDSRCSDREPSEYRSENFLRNLSP
jgi:hypothetical protein